MTILKHNSYLWFGKMISVGNASMLYSHRRSFRSPSTRTNSSRGWARSSRDTVSSCCERTPQKAQCAE